MQDSKRFASIPLASLLLGVVLLSTAAPADAYLPAQWSAPARIDDANATAGRVFAHASTPSGGSLVVWWQPHGGYSLWASTIDTSGEWTAPTPVSEASVGAPSPPTARGPALGMDADGRALAFWVQIVDSGWRVAAAPHDLVSGWGTPFMVEHEGDDATDLSAAADANGNVTVAWVQKFNGTKVVRATRCDVGGTCDAPQNLSTGAIASLTAIPVVASANGSALVAWGQGPNGARHSWAAWYRPPTGWEPAFQVEDVPGEAVYLTAGSNAAGDVYLAWINIDGTNRTDRNVGGVRFDPAVGWLTPERPDPQRMGWTDGPSVAVNGAGDVAVVWREELSNGTSRTFANVSVKGAGWSGVTQVSHHDSGYGTYIPSVTAHTTGVFVAAWAFNGRIYSALFKGGGVWTDEVPCPSFGTYPYTPALAEGRNGRVVAVFMSGDLGTGGIWTTSLQLPRDTLAPYPDAGPDETVFVGEAFMRTGVASDDDAGFPSGGATSWEFEYNGTQVVVPGDDLDFTFWVEGTYQLTYFAQDASGNLGADVMFLIVKPADRTAPLVNAGPPVQAELGEKVNLSMDASDNDPRFPLGATFEWQFEYNGSTVTLEGKNQSFEFWAYGRFEINAVVWDRWGNRGNDTTLVVVPAPDTEPPVLSPVADIAAEVGEPVHFQATATDDSPLFEEEAVYHWQFADGGSTHDLVGSSQEYTFRAPGDYAVTVSVQDGAGNQGVPVTFTVHVVPPDTEPPVVFILEPTGPVEAGTLVTMSGSATDGGAPVEAGSAFTWTLLVDGKSRTLVGPEVSYRFDAPGLYAVTLTVTDAAGNSGTAERGITVVAPQGGEFPALEVGAGAVAAVAGVLAVLILRKRRPPPGGQPPEIP